MYTLRRISSEGVEMNYYLGKSYTVVDSEKAPERFKEDHIACFRELGATDEMAPENLTYAFVGNEDGSFVQPLYKNQRNYIVSESGKTISNLTEKKWHPALEAMDVKGLALEGK